MKTHVINNKVCFLPVTSSLVISSVSSKIDGKINYWQKINIFGKENHIRNKAQKNVNDRYQKECKTISTEKD